MDHDNLFLIGLTIVMVTLITSVGACYYQKSTLIAEGIAAGGDPQKVSCAYDALPYCDILTAQTANQSK